MLKMSNPCLLLGDKAVYCEVVLFKLLLSLIKWYSFVSKSRFSNCVSCFYFFLFLCGYFAPSIVHSLLYFLFFSVVYLFIFKLLLFSHSCPTFFPFAHHNPAPLLSQSIPPHCPCPGVLYSCSIAYLFPSPPCFPSSLSPLVTVSLFFISKSQVLFCSFVLVISFHS